MELEHVDVYFDSTRQIRGVFLGTYNGRDMCYEESYVTAVHNTITDAETLVLVDRAIANWRAGR